MPVCPHCGKVSTNHEPACECGGPKARRRRLGCWFVGFLLCLPMAGCGLKVCCDSGFYLSLRGGGDQEHALIARVVMESIGDMESAFFDRTDHYGSLPEIGADSPRLRELSQGSNGYSLILNYSADHYQLTATAYPRRNWLCCLFGLGPLKSFYLDESAVLRQNLHCRPATKDDPPR